MIATATVSPRTHTQILRMLCLKLSTTYDPLPTSFYLQRVKRIDAEPFDQSGSYADIYLGRYNDTQVVLKRPRASQQYSGMKSQSIKHFCRESLLWKKLDHLYVLPFLGISRDVWDPMCIVLPYMRNGAIRRRLRAQETHLRLTIENFEEHVNRWLYEAALGVEYLYGQGVVHGDLHCGNILMDAEDHVRITTFGFALIAAATPGQYGSVHGGAAPQCNAPELLGIDEADEADESNDLSDRRPTVASDVYAFACTSVELYGDEHPWGNATPARIVMALARGRRPERPVTPHGGLMPQPMWDLVQACWKEQPSERLGISALVQKLDAIASSKC
ncbi:hypothetical protein EUX98_g6456 [Antrodiella citrinella]|uniref:Protein kinase domain-containing protein n=1 Tax=Antrodiella citrinella TaxID=2447956 RepID=A0A4S4MQT6_9APHY|nr:hypothetical protein EUX98_g6456 [Antrodiella citrinella]